MINIKDKKRCSGCNACMNACPLGCIEMRSDSEGFLYPKVDHDKCSNCNVCEKSCPILNHTISTNSPKIYSAYNKEENVRVNSSSGGIFTLISKYIIKQGGVVFGACFNEKLEVVHSCAKTYEELAKFRGSKYVQSVIGSTYRQAMTLLEEGKLVLFTGTPCQISGLLSYLQKGYPNLYTHDLICHGVPSPLAWKKYSGYCEKCAGASIEKVTFRNKETGWKTYSISIKFTNGTIYKSLSSDDIYIKGFLSDLYLRPSCHGCSFKTIHRQSDITLADFWGVQNVFPEMDDDKGISVVMVNTEKGQMLFDKIKESLILNDKEIEIGLIEKYNPSIIKASIAHKNRKNFFENIHNYEFDNLISKYCKISFDTKIKQQVFSILSKIKHTVIK